MFVEDLLTNVSAFLVKSTQQLLLYQVSQCMQVLGLNARSGQCIYLFDLDLFWGFHTTDAHVH